MAAFSPYSRSWQGAGDASRRGVRRSGIDGENVYRAISACKAASRDAACLLAVCVAARRSKHAASASPSTLSQPPLSRPRAVIRGRNGADAATSASRAARFRRSFARRSRS